MAYMAGEGVPRAVKSESMVAEKGLMARKEKGNSWRVKMSFNI